MCCALKIVVCVAVVLVSTVASEDRKKRADYDTLSDSPWQSPTSWGFRPSSNYNNIPSTRILRVNNPYQSRGRNIQSNQVENQGAPSELYGNREQSSGWIPIIPNQQNNGVRYGQNGPQRQQGYSRLNAYNKVNVEEQLLNEIIRQRQPSYSVQRNRGHGVNPQSSRSNKGNLLEIQLNRNVNQQGRDYIRQPIYSFDNRQRLQNSGRTIRPTYYSRINTDQIRANNIQRENRGYLQQQRNQLGGVLNQEALRHSLGSNELPVVEGRFLGYNYQPTTPVVQSEQKNVEPVQQVLRVVNPNQSIRTYRLPVVQGPIGNLQQVSAGYAVEEPINEPQNEINQQALANQIVAAAHEQNRNSGRIPSGLVVQDVSQSNEARKQLLGLINSEILRNRELEALRGSYPVNNIQQNDQQIAEQGINSLNDGRYAQTLTLVNSKPILRLNQGPVLQGQLRDNIVNQQYADSLNQPRSQVLKLIPQNVPLNINNNLRLSPQPSAGRTSASPLLASQSPNEEWRQGRLSAIDELRNNEENTRDQLTARNPNLELVAQTQQDGNQNDANQQPNVYTYAELTARIWKLIKANPTMMSNLPSLREQLLNRQNSRNEQLRELEGLLQEARKYDRNVAQAARNEPGQTLEEQQRDAFVSDLIDTMNKNDIESDLPNLRGQVPYETANQARYIVRPGDVNPLIKNILFSNARRNETEAQNVQSGVPAPIIVVPKTNIPLPQLEVSQPYGLDQLEHHYDLTQWKQATELLRGNPFLQQINVHLEHLV